MFLMAKVNGSFLAPTLLSVFQLILSKHLTCIGSSAHFLFLLRQKAIFCSMFDQLWSVAMDISV